MYTTVRDIWVINYRMSKTNGFTEKLYMVQISRLSGQDGEVEKGTFPEENFQSLEERPLVQLFLELFHRVIFFLSVQIID